MTVAMKFSVSVLSLLFFLSAPTISLCMQTDLHLNTADLTVPGDSPLQYCEEDHSSDILAIDYFNVDPNPPLPGKNGTVHAAGTLSKDVEEGAYVKLHIKFNKYITILKTTVDLCEQVKSADKECPLQKGPIKVTKEFTLPEEIPKGIWTVIADIYTSEDERITCVTAEVDYAKQSVDEL